MNKKEDLRIQKTRGALRAAFFDIIDFKRIEEITVNELCERAGVRRATFYKHYRDKNDFLLGIIKYMREEFDSSLPEGDAQAPGTDYYVAYAEALVDYLLSHIAIVDNLLHSEMRGAFFNMLLTQNFIDTHDRLNASVRNGLRLSVSPKTATCFLTGGIGMTLLVWFESGREQSREWLIGEITKAIELLL